MSSTSTDIATPIKFHPIRFAGFCYCARCKQLVNYVETDHPYGLDKGPWTIRVFCHGCSYPMELSAEAVEQIASGAARPVPTIFFEKDGMEGRALSPLEIVALEEDHGGNVFHLSHLDREDLKASVDRTMMDRAIRSAARRTALEMNDGQ